LREIALPGAGMNALGRLKRVDTVPMKQTPQNTNLERNCDSIQYDCALVRLIPHLSPSPWIGAIAISLMLWSLIIWTAYHVVS
jgi:hypothetical protein